MKNSKPIYTKGRRGSSFFLVLLFVLTLSGYGQADPFGVNWPAFKDSTPAELGQPDIVFVIPNYSSQFHAYYDGKTQSYWWYNNGHWAGYFRDLGNGYECTELRSNGRLTNTWVESNPAEQLPGGRVKVSGYIVENGRRTGGSWYATFQSR